MIDVSVTIVSYNTCDLLDRCIASIYRHAGELTIETIVVDNASADGSTEMIRAKYPQVHLITNTENRYYARANNQAFAVARGRYVLVLNPDIELVDDSIKQMVRFMDEHPKAAIAGCALFGKEGSQQRTYWPYTTVWDVGKSRWPLTMMFPSVCRLRRCNLEVHRDPHPVDVVINALSLIRREVIEQIGGYDANFLLYCTEDDFCRRARQKQWQVYFYPAAQAFHQLNASTRSLGWVQKLIITRRDFMWYFRKHEGGMACLAVNIALSLELFLVWLAVLAKSTLRRTGVLR